MNISGSRPTQQPLNLSTGNGRSNYSELHIGPFSGKAPHAIVPTFWLVPEVKKKKKNLLVSEMRRRVY
jgi:hypothetical protein